MSTKTVNLSSECAANVTVITNYQPFTQKMELLFKQDQKVSDIHKKTTASGKPGISNQIVIVRNCEDPSSKMMCNDVDDEVNLAPVSQKSSPLNAFNDEASTGADVKPFPVQLSLTVEPTLHCCVLNCPTTSELIITTHQTCSEHTKSQCSICYPYSKNLSLFAFPTHEYLAFKWHQLINRKNLRCPENGFHLNGTGLVVCSRHFPEGRPTCFYPFPVLNLGYEEPRSPDIDKYLHDPSLRPPIVEFRLLKTFVGQEWNPDESEEVRQMSLTKVVVKEEPMEVHETEVELEDTVVKLEKCDEYMTEIKEDSHQPITEAQLDSDGPWVAAILKPDIDPQQIPKTLQLNMAQSVQKMAEIKQWRKKKRHGLLCGICHAVMESYHQLGQHYAGSGCVYWKLSTAVIHDRSDITGHISSPGHTSLQCRQCLAQFTSKHLFDHHFLTSSCIIDCHVCKEIFNRIDVFQEHMKTHKPVCRSAPDHQRKFSRSTCLRGIQCPTCNERLDNFAIFIEHCSKDNCNTDKQCPYCLEAFPDVLQMDLHAFRHLERVYSDCMVCSASFKTRSEKDEHMRTEHDDKMTCRICKCTFVCDRTLRFHLSEHTSKSPRICDQRATSCTNITPDSARIKSRRTKAEKVFVCEVCGSSYERKAHYLVHMRLHGDKPFKCNACERGFRTRRSLRIHQRKHQHHDKPQ